jgi:uncharacterized protein (TIGR02302 family)
MTAPRFSPRYAAVLAVSFLALLAERIWRGFWPVLCLITAFCGLSFLGVFSGLGGWSHVALLAAFVAVAIALGKFFGTPFAFPSRDDTERHIEKQSNLTHRPLHTLRDAPVTNDAPALWQAHRAQAADALKNTRVYRPVSDVPAQDRYHLRFAALALFLLGLIVAQGDSSHRLTAALTAQVSIATGMSASIDAWIAPPEYTRANPVFLTSSRTSVPAIDGDITVPENSVLKIRLGGFRFAPAVFAGGQRLDVTAASPRNYTAEMPLSASGDISIRYFMIPLHTWTVNVTPDKTPDIALDFASPTDRGALKISYSIDDDYAVRRLTGVIGDGQHALHFDIPPPAEANGTFTHLEDLSWHPQAGSFVELTLTATDDAGNTGVSKPQRVLLPERKFNNPAAERIILERKRLIMFDNKLTQRLVIRALTAITANPTYYRGDPMTFLHLAVTVKRLSYDGDAESVATVIPHLWDIALRIEDGGLTQKARELSDALQKLSQALDNKNISKAEIDLLVQDVQKKMGDYMRTLAMEMQQRMELSKNMKSLSPEVAARIMKHIDLEKMMEQMRKMREGSGREQLQKMADMLKGAVDNLDINQMQKMQERQQKNIQTLEDLQNLINAQQDLFDRTARAGDGEAPDLKSQQDTLRGKLGDVMRAVGEMTPNMPENFGKADQAMKAASDALKTPDTKTAAQHQKDALAQLQQGMDDIAQQMAQAMAEMMSFGMMPGGGQYGGENDPLGRDIGTSSDVEIPDEAERRRVQDILRELRDRSNDYQRPKVERDYIDRLLDQFN